MYTRCDTHKTREDLPRLCALCQRIAVEADIVTRAIDALLVAGFELQIDGCGDDDRPEQPVSDRARILREMMETDDDVLMTWRKDHDTLAPQGWVRFVYGNDGYDVISDYTTNLEDVLAPVNAYADTLA